ncbi:S41 family peptidase [Pseudoalteromonas xiamenensis]
MRAYLQHIKVGLVVGFSLLSFASIANQTSAVGALEKILTVEQMQQDINAWQTFMDNTHPDLGIRVTDPTQLKASIESLRDSLTAPLTTKAFINKLAIYNGQFHDGHMSIMVRSQKKLAKSIIDEHQALLPFEVTVKDSKVYVRSKLGGEFSEYQNAELKSINGLPVSSIYQTLIERTYGDTVRHKEALLSNKFALFYWLFVNPTPQFNVELEHNKQQVKLALEGSAQLPSAMRTKSFEDTFQFTLLDNKQALLTINEFWWEDKKAFYDFTKNVFQTLKEKQIEHLIIDVRQNPGGDDDTWKTGLLRYLADKPYRHTRRYTKKILAKYQDEGEVVGDVLSKNYDKYEPVVADEPLKFKGKVSVVVGALTYSSAILFTNTMQDFGFAQIVGEPSGGYAWQTGGIQFFTLPNSGLLAVSPRFYLERPVGGSAHEQIKPDVVLTDNPLATSQVIADLANKSATDL